MYATVTQRRRLQTARLVTLADYAHTVEDQPFVSEIPSSRSVQVRLGQEGTPTLIQAMRYLRQLAGILQDFHNHGRMHGAISPVTTALSDNEQVLVATFGEQDSRLTAEAAHRPERALDALRQFAPGFIAPEIQAGEQPDTRSDVYGLGVWFHFLLVGTEPSGAVSRRIPGAIAAIIRNAIAVAPESRYQTVGAMLAELEEISTDQLVLMDQELHLALHATGFDPRLLWRRHPVTLVASLVLVGLLITSVVFGHIYWDRKQQQKLDQLTKSQTEQIARNYYLHRTRRADREFEKGDYRDAIELYDVLIEEATVPASVEGCLIGLARSHGALKNFGEEYAAWLRLLSDFPDSSVAGEANERLVRIASLALKRYGDLVDITGKQEVIVDGVKTNDWLGMEPIIIDEKNDNSRGGKASDLIAAYAMVKDDTLYFRFDTADSPHEGDQYCVAIYLNAFAYEDSTDEWDYQIGVAKNIKPWIWDLRGDRDYKGSTSKPLHGVMFAQKECVEFSIPLSAIGNPTSMGLRVFMNYSGMRQANDVVKRKVLVRWDLSDKKQLAFFQQDDDEETDDTAP